MIPERRRLLNWCRRRDRRPSLPRKNPQRRRCAPTQRRQFALQRFDVLSVPVQVCAVRVGRLGRQCRACLSQSRLFSSQLGGQNFAPLAVAFLLDSSRHRREGCPRRGAG
jgi:hypothetical protein